MKTVVVIPTYNEFSLIQPLVEKILQLHPDFDILVVDDNSPDGTGDVVERLGRRLSNVSLLKRPRKAGLGTAYIEGFRYVMSRNVRYDRVIEMDADFSHEPEYISALLDATSERVVSIGSRYIPGGKIVDWRVDRRFISYAANVYVGFLLGFHVRDWTSGFRCFSREAVAMILSDHISSKGYLFQIEVLSRLCRNGYSIREVPIVFSERKIGNTKLGFKEVWEAMWGIWRFKWCR
jgi:dolichol-phosphate mannosyltransferase